MSHSTAPGGTERRKANVRFGAKPTVVSVMMSGIGAMLSYETLPLPIVARSGRSPPCGKRTGTKPSEQVADGEHLDGMRVRCTGSRWVAVVGASKHS